MTCTITGPAILADGAPLPNATFKFYPVPFSVLGVSGSGVVPEPISTTSDANGLLSFELIPGIYVGKYRTTIGAVEFDFLVENYPSRTFAQCLEAAGLPVPPQSVLDARAAADDAQAAAALTAADRVQTGLDRTSATGSASTATTQAGIAMTRAGIATTQAYAAQSSATAAAASEAAAAGSATIATTQAGIATTQATTATTQAGIATTQAASATASAATATTQASAASASAAAAAASQSAAATARTAAETAQTGAQTARTGAEAAQTSAQTVRTGAEAARDVAQAQASLSAGYAASAASVVQQDLSGVTAQALHRSPNAITAMFIYDTSKDSDGGAWTEKCQHTSWWNEAINGKWLGPQATEAAARAVSGATTGDYFQRTSDGLFYSLNAGSGITQVYRGNKRDFPRLAGIVAEAASVTIYDLTEPGRPMWMRFVATAVNGLYATSVSGVFAVNGFLTTTGNAGLGNVLFLNDSLFARGSSYVRTYLGNIAQRNAALAYGLSTSGLIANETTNAVAITVLPDAPVHPVTGLRVPTLAVATAGGVSVIRHDGTVQSQVFYGGDARSVRFDGRRVLIGAITPGSYYGAYVWDLSDNTTQDYGATAVVRLDPNTGTRQVRTVGQNYAALQGGAELRLLRHNKTPSRSILARVANTFNTGWMAGDVRRCFLSDTAAGSVTGPELVTNGGFDTADGWGTTNTTISGGVANINATGSVVALDRALNTPSVLGKAYEVTFTVSSYVSGAAYAVLRVGNNVGGGTISANGTYRAVLFSQGNPNISIYSNAAGFVGSIDNLSVREVVADRSYKAQGASITGSITKAELASGTSLMAYSGWSASNYLREAYSADLDFGTGEWTANAWVNIPTGNAAAGTILSRAFSSGAYITLGIDATNKLVATAYDGTTTRTVTSSAAYNTATWIKARVNYTTDGSLTLLVNGREVAVTRGAPLLTLNNASAVLTIGNSYDLAAPFPGSIALLKLGATVPTAEQAIFMFEQEKQLFRAGALSVLPDAGALVDMAYDAATDRWVALSAANESWWTGLVRNSVTAVPAGSFSRVVAGSGVELAARTTTNPGVDVTIPAYGLREELVRRAEAAARLSRELAVYDFVGGFTANTTNGSTAIASVASLTYPTSYIGAPISGAGIPANTTTTAVSGTTIYLSAAATATATGVSISFLDFVLPVGMEAKSVLSAGALRQEGSTKDYTRLFNGFAETIRFAVAPGATAWVQIQAAKGAVQ